MFTGIIESLGDVVRVESNGVFLTMTVRSDISHTLRPDQSVSHNGVCLTVVEATEQSHTVQLVLETLRRSTFADVAVGDVLNLERAMPAGGRFEGHIVQGHVDGVGQLTGIKDGIYAFSFPEAYAKYLVGKGSICVHGVSLTIAHLDEAEFGVALIPHTLQHTNLGALEIGSGVNLEFDMIAKHLVRLIEMQQR